jgi:hypothetical protein
LSIARALGLSLATVVACSDPGPASFGDPTTDPQLPPRGHEDILGWLAAGHYQAWRCEAAAHGPRPPSPHGTTRICNNDALTGAAGDGPFPVGAASVKEILQGDRIALYAVYRKVAAGAGGATWYWFEGVEGDIIANGTDDDTCTGCHRGAPRDFVFTVVPP